MSSQIRTIVESNVPSRYAREARPTVDAVVSALEAAAANAADVIRAAGRNAGVSNEQVEAVLVDAGLVQPAPEPTPEATTNGSDGIDAGLFHRLADFARQHGFRG